METKIPTGTTVMDWLLEGGYEKDCITTIYGPAGSGKTNLCMIAAAHVPKGKKVIYIDTEGSFSVTRLKQITDDWEDVLERVLILQPTSFEEQQGVFEKLKDLVGKNIWTIILDSVAMLYRLEIGKTKDVHKVNRELGTQMAYLTQLARKQHIPVLITNQVYADFDDKDRVKLVGGDLLRYASKCLIELQKTDDGRKAVLRKHRSIEEDKEVSFRIVDRGVEEYG
ncbi:MAG: DNA repair and recombination protein RadB [Candidatus Woesearchaeota archaeon]